MPRLVGLGGGETRRDIGKEVESKEKQEEKVFHGCFPFLGYFISASLEHRRVIFFVVII
jgi:hypothetical protein